MTATRLGPGRWREPESPEAYRDLFLEHVQEDVLRFWERAVDRSAGGFHTDLDRRARPRGPQRRFVVHVARLVWSFAAAHRAGLGGGRYLPLAERAADTLERFWDRRRGGWCQETDRDGSVMDPARRLYGQTFGIFALAELALASGSDAARRRALEAVDLLAGRWRAPHGGFVSGWAGGGEPIGGGPDPNSHIHVMEAIVPVLELTGDAGHRDLLREARDLVRDRMLVATEGGGTRMADRLDRSWRPVPGPGGHVESYGHGVETGWLLLQAAEALGEPVSETLPVAGALVDRGLAVGRDPRWGGLYFRGTAEAGPRDRRKVWWTQAEGLVAFLRLAAESGDPRYLLGFRDVARWIMRRQADLTHGEWYAILRRSGTVQDGRKSHRWKSAYHTTRACLESVRLAPRLRERFAAGGRWT